MTTQTILHQQKQFVDLGLWACGEYSPHGYHKLSPAEIQENRRNKQMS